MKVIVVGEGEGALHSMCSLYCRLFVSASRDDALWAVYGPLGFLRVVIIYFGLGHHVFK